MDGSAGVELFAVVSLWVLPLPSAAQGGWRAWDIYLRDGSRIEAAQTTVGPRRERSGGRAGLDRYIKFADSRATPCKPKTR